MTVSYELHASDTSLPKIGLSVPIQQEAGWAALPFWTLWRKEIPLTTLQDRS